MAYLNCPHCAQRLRVPDSPQPVRLRCPACRHAFGSDGQPLEVGAEQPAEEGEQAGFLPPGVGDGGILSAADEAMLREYGAGSGLLELTREAYAVSTASPPLPQAAEEEAPARAPAGPPDGQDRQFQIIGTALVLANKLVQAHKAELVRTRRQAVLGWALLAGMAAAAALAFWWAMGQTGQTNLERVRAANLEERIKDLAAQLSEHKAQIPKLAADLEASRAEYRSAQADLATAREDLAEKRGSLEALTAERDGANARISVLSERVEALHAELAVAKAAAQSAATQPATAPAGAPAPPQ